VLRATRKYHFSNNFKRRIHTTTSLLDEEKSYYEVLGLEPTANSKEIKAAYLELSKKLHPDANPGNPEAATQFHIVSGAYATLNNAKLRRMYDKNELGRMSSVADRESSTHSFDGAGFVEGRARFREQMMDRNKTGGSPRDNLDKWVKNATTENFNKLKHKNSELQSGGSGRQFNKFHGNVSQERRQFTSSRETNKGSGPLPLVFMVVLVIVIINKIIS